MTAGALGGVGIVKINEPVGGCGAIVLPKEPRCVSTVWRWMYDDDRATVK